MTDGHSQTQFQEDGSTKRVIFCGSRNWIDRDLIRATIELRKEQYGDDLVVVHGAARGADAIAAEEAEKLGVPTEAHPADWDRHGKAAGHIRNEEMAKAGAVRVEAFWDGKSKGTWNMVKTGERHGIRWSLHFGKPDRGSLAD